MVESCRLLEKEFLRHMCMLEHGFAWVWSQNYFPMKVNSLIKIYLLHLIQISTE